MKKRNTTRHKIVSDLTAAICGLNKNMRNPPKLTTTKIDTRIKKYLQSINPDIFTQQTIANTLNECGITTKTGLKITPSHVCNSKTKALQTNRKIKEKENYKKKNWIYYNKLSKKK